MTTTRIQGIIKGAQKDIQLYTELIAKNERTQKEYGFVEFDGCIERYKNCLTIAKETLKNYSNEI